MTDWIRVLIVDDIEETRMNLRKALSFESRIDVVAEAENGFQAIDFACKYKPDIILMDINMPDMDGIQATERISLKCPSANVIVISVQREQDYLRKAMLAGAKEFLIKPFSPDELIQAVITVYEKNKQRAVQVYAHQILEQGYVQSPKIITVFSGKGGVGKSLIAANLAAGLNQRNKKVVVLDLDLMFGDIAAMFNLKVKETIYHVVQEIERLDAESLLSYLYETNSGVRVLAAPLRPEQSEVVTGKHVEKILRLLKETHDYVIVDTPAQLTDPVLALDSSNLTLLVNTLNIPVFRHNRTVLEVMDAVNYPTDRVRLIINRADLDTGIKPKDIKTALGMEPYSLLPEDKYADLSINRGEPLIEMKPGSKWAKQMNKLIEMISAEDERSKSESWLSRFVWKKKRK
ncbi:response regulator [Tepidibacillus fermentans]|uniref:Pilus assembly protein CpaE n=1 Tax=Tepidibacillus fermentans TaxID=1281767 RepID=A0A4V2USZ0_9BACI|nr:response regulator [Tepidibacillus fermentans]TCS83334.1 pilus assembly protein CpaE [Tepidibacillus fermentans]